MTKSEQIGAENYLIEAEAPLGEVIEGFSNEIKASTQGYASYEYSPIGFRESNIQHLRITIMDEEVGAFQCFVHESNAFELGKRIC